MIEPIVLGTAQGISEWLPVSSSAVLITLKNNFFGGGSITDNTPLILFLHLGTFFAAAIYFWRDILGIFKTLFSYHTRTKHDQSLFVFLVVTTIISAFLGSGLLIAGKNIEEAVSLSTSHINLVVGVLLLITTLIISKNNSSHTYGSRAQHDLSFYDGIFLGFLQSIAALPGISRSGITIAGLLIRKIDKVEALKISFLMGLPITLGGNIALKFTDFVITQEYLIALLFSFLFGLLTIHLLIKIAQRINFAKVTFLFGILLIIAAFFPF